MYYKNRTAAIFFLIFLFLTGLNVSAQELELSMPDSSGMVGDEVILPVLLSDSGISEDVYSYQLQLSFSDSRLKALEIITDETVSESFGTVVSNLDTEGEISIAAAGASPLVTDGVLFYIRFELLSSTSNASVNFDEQESYFNEKGDIPTTFSGGRISIDALPSFSVSPINRTLFVGEEQSMNVSFGTGPVTWSSGDESVATIDSDGVVTALDFGTAEITATDTNGISNNNRAIIEVRNIKISYENHEIFQGNEISIPVYLDNPNDYEIYSGQLNTSWSNDLITSYTINTNETLLEGSTPEVNTASGSFEMAFALSSPLPNEDKPLFYLEIETSPDFTGTTFQMSSAEFNKENPGYLDSGRLRVNSLPNLSISPNNPTLIAGETQQFSVSNATGDVEWSVSDSNIATIDESGLMTTSSGGLLQVTVEDEIGATTSTNTFLVYDGWVTTPDTTFFSGKTEQLPVRIDELPAGKSVLSYEMEISYNSSRMTFAGVNTSGTLTDGWSAADNRSDGSVTLAAAGTSSFEGPGTVVYLLFDIEPGLSNTNASFTISDIKLNEGDPAVRTETPNISITNQLSAPSLTSPANNSSGQDIDGQMNWEPVSGADYYHLQISADNGFSSLIVDEENLPDTNFDYSLENSETYYWRVKALNDDSESSWSSTFSFTTADPTPGTVSAASPEDEATGLDTEITFEWFTASDALTYQIQISENDSFGSSHAEETTADTVQTISGFEYNSSYSWRVRGIHNDVNGEWSEVRTFTTKEEEVETTPGSVTLVYPVSEVIQDEESIEFTWENVDDADQYEIEVSEESDFSSIIFSDQLSETVRTFTGFEEKTYYWRVRAGNSVGWGDFTSASFDVEMSVNIDGTMTGIPDKLELHQNYPNPFNPSSTIQFDLPEADRVKIEIFNTIGQQVAVVTDRFYQAGNHQVTFDGSSLTSGIYIYRLTIADQALTRSMTLVK